MINNVVLVGRITKDPELRQTNSNIPYVRFTLAVNRAFSDPSGERQADFIGCIVWRKQAENLAKYMKQGSLIGVEGRIQTGSFESPEGMRYTTDIVCNSIQFLESRGSTNQSPSTNNNNSNNNNNNNDNEDYYAASEKLFAENDLPF